MLPILAAVIAFGLLVVVHELGHYAVARLCGMRVERFSVGFGPVLLRRRTRGTEWAISVVPFGGYVKIAGMSAEEEIAPDDAGAYANHAAWRRFLVILAGPGMNYVLAVAMAAVMLATGAFREVDPAPIVGDVSPGSAAEVAGLRPGDRVLTFDGRPVDSFQALRDAIEAHPGVASALIVQRPGAAAPLAIAATPRAEGKVGKLGVGPHMRPVRVPAAEAIGVSVRMTHHQVGEMLSGLGQLVSGRARGPVKGPLGIGEMMARSARGGAAPFLTIVWLVSIALAVFNLLPVPALDGGRLVFLVYEIATRRRVNQRVETVVHLAGMVALFGLLIGITIFGDLPGIVRGVLHR